MTNQSLKLKFKKIASIASHLERVVQVELLPESKISFVCKDINVLRNLLDEINTLSPEVRELLELENG